VSQFENLGGLTGGMESAALASCGERLIRGSKMNSHSRGVLLIQRLLLKYGIQFDPSKARTGIDIVAFVPKTGKHLTIRVMACQKPIPAGGKGAPSVGWGLPKESVAADLVAVTKLDDDKAWLFRRKEYEDKAQQKNESGWHLYFYVEPKPHFYVEPKPPSKDGSPHERDFAKFVIECRMHDIFGIGIDGKDIQAMATGRGMQLTRQIGEHLVAAELGRKSYVATPFAGNVPMYDLLAANISGHAIPIQVKAINGGSWQFDAGMFLDIESVDGQQINKGKKMLVHPELLCIFVLIKSPGSDEFYVFQLKDLQDHCAQVYKPRGPNSKNPNSTHCAVSPKDFKRFLNNWDLLESSTGR
jgi:hypothetical protein